MKDFPAFYDICSKKTTLYWEEVKFPEPITIFLVSQPQYVPGPQPLDSFQSLDVLNITTVPYRGCILENRANVGFQDVSHELWWSTFGWFQKVVSNQQQSLNINNLVTLKSMRDLHQLFQARMRCCKLLTVTSLARKAGGARIKSLDEKFQDWYI